MLYIADLFHPTDGLANLIQHYRMDLPTPVSYHLFTSNVIWDFPYTCRRWRPAKSTISHAMPFIRAAPLHHNRLSCSHTSRSLAIFQITTRFIRGVQPVQVPHPKPPYRKDSHKSTNPRPSSDIVTHHDVGLFVGWEGEDRDPGLVLS